MATGFSPLHLNDSPTSRGIYLNANQLPSFNNTHNLLCILQNTRCSRVQSARQAAVWPFGSAFPFTCALWSLLIFTKFTFNRELIYQSKNHAGGRLDRNSAGSGGGQGRKIWGERDLEWQATIKSAVGVILTLKGVEQFEWQEEREGERNMRPTRQKFDLFPGKYKTCLLAKSSWYFNVKVLIG